MAKQGKNKQDEYSGWLNEVRNNPPRPYPWKSYKDSLISPSHKNKARPHGDQWVGFISLGGGFIILVTFMYACFKAFTQQETGSALALLLVGLGAGFFFIRVGIENIRNAPAKQKPSPKKKKSS